MIHFDLSAAEQFLACLDGRFPLAQVLEHPAYKLVFEHARRFSDGLTVLDVEHALAGQNSPFYGLDELAARRARIVELLSVIRTRQSDWAGLIREALETLGPLEDRDIILYPIIGYDMGIGLVDGAAMNLNTGSFLDDPREFLFYAIHECTHALYERRHSIPPLSAVISPADWRAYFHLWLHNEGFATYVPWPLRQRYGGVRERDYAVLSDPLRIEATLAVYREILARLALEHPLGQEEYLECCFGDRRITYRAGCELIRRIEVRHGMDAVRQAFQMTAGQFSDSWGELLGSSSAEVA